LTGNAPDPAAKLLGAEQRKNLLDRIALQLKVVNDWQKAETAFAALRKARANGDEEKIRLALQEVLVLPGLSEQQRLQYQDQLKALDIAKLLAEAKKEIDTGNSAAALAGLEKVLALDPENIEAKNLRSTLQKASDRARWIREGDAAFNDGDFEGAIELYQKATRLGGGTDLRDKIKECNFNLLLAQADDARNELRYAEAEAFYEKAKDLKPDAAPLVDNRLEDMRVDQKFRVLMSEGNDFLQREKWEEAVGKYKEAQSVLTPGKMNEQAEADRAIAFATYKKHIQAGEEARSIGDKATARWHYRLAQREMDTEEVRRLLTSVQE
jgi:tetratricopeptide (TPR) repeat protein